jgi:hypothetical protein
MAGDQIGGETKWIETKVAAKAWPNLAPAARQTPPFDRFDDLKSLEMFARMSQGKVVSGYSRGKVQSKIYGANGAEART